MLGVMRRGVMIAGSLIGGEQGEVGTIGTAR